MIGEPDGDIIKVGDLVARRVSVRTWWTVSIGDAMGSSIGDVFQVVAPQERQLGWWVAIWSPTEYVWLNEMSDEEKESLDLHQIKDEWERDSEGPNVAGWGRSAEQAVRRFIKPRDRDPSA